jgi:hypothetical protein
MTLLIQHAVRLLCVLAAFPGTFITSASLAADPHPRWVVADTGPLRLYICSPPACRDLVTVAVSPPSNRPLPAPQDLWENPDHVRRLTEGFMRGFARGSDAVDILMPFRRADIGGHSGLLGVVRAINGQPMAAFVSFKGASGRAFMATATTQGEALDAIVEITASVPPP